MNLREQFGELMMKERERQKLSRKDLADKIGVNERFIRQWERGELNITSESIERVSQGLGRRALIKYS